jgi:hypothetical protein
MIVGIGTCCSTTWNTLLGSLVHQHRKSSRRLLPHFEVLSIPPLSIHLCILSIHAVPLVIDQELDLAISSHPSIQP